MERAVGRRFALGAWPGMGFFALYHPAYLLRSLKRRPLALGHLEGIRATLPAGRDGGGARTVARSRTRVV